MLVLTPVVVLLILRRININIHRHVWQTLPSVVCEIETSLGEVSFDILYGPKIGSCAPLGEGDLGPHLAQCGQGRGLPTCQVSS